jgi:hypothetical protein
MTDEYLTFLVPIAVMGGTWVYKTILVYINKYTSKTKWTLPVVSVVGGVLCLQGLSLMQVHLISVAPEPVKILFGAFMGAAATGFHQLLKTAKEALDDYNLGK